MFATDQAIAKFDAVILQYIEPLSMTLQQYGEDLNTKAC